MSTDHAIPALSAAGLRAPATWPRERHQLLGGAPDDPAIITAATSVTYGDLTALVRARADELGGTRRLLVVQTANDLETVVTYLAALKGHHPVLLAGPGDTNRCAELVERYSPDVVQTAGGRLRALRPGSRHELHPDLAVLLSTSGSTGSPKLVRLSRTNVVENASSIAAYLTILPTDRAVTSLPLHYCYGLSVLNSHLLSGAGIVLTDLSVADECFWDLAVATGVTSLAGVPYTFDLLEAAGFRDRHLPSLRYLTQAGGRMDPELVQAYAELGRSRGWDLYVMYGQTEATARMAYLPPDLAAERPDAIGIPVPGGQFHLDHSAAAEYPDLGPDVGELVYTGANVMMGYAEHPEHLAEGASLTELPTGDLARQADDGLWEIVGRLNRYAKVFGLRIDLAGLEAQLAERGCPAWLVARADQIWAFVDKPRSRTESALRQITQLPAGAVRVVTLDRLPLTPSGKPDHAALSAHVDRVLDLEREKGADSLGHLPVNAEGIRDLYAVLLVRPDATTRDSFVDLGGDSLSYVEVSLRLGALLGDLPPQWPQLTPDRLAGTGTRRRRFTVPVDVSVALRAVAITLILVTHADIFQVQGGAHILLAVAGFNLARFQLAIPGRAARVRGIVRAAQTVVVPAMLWISGVILVAGTYRWQTAFFLNGLTGRDSWTLDWQFWFLESLVWTYAGLAALVAVPRLDRWQRSRPFATALAVLAACLTVRFLWVGLEAESTERYTTGVVLWCVALGWAAAVARTPAQRVTVGAAAVLSTVGFFDDGRRETIVIVGILLLLVDRPLHLPRRIAALLRVLAGASLWIYLTQWQVYPSLEDAGHPVTAVLTSLVVGVLCLALYRLGTQRLERARSILAQCRTPPLSPASMQ